MGSSSVITSRINRIYACISGLADSSESQLREDLLWAVNRIEALEQKNIKIARSLQRQLNAQAVTASETVDIREAALVLAGDDDETTALVYHVTKSGYCYLMHAVDDTAYKIGFSVHPRTRRNQIQVQMHKPLLLVCDIRTDDMLQLENELKAKFADKRIRGEWYALDPADVEYIKGLAK